MIKTLRQRCLRAIKHPAAILLWPVLIVYLLTAKGHVEISDTDYSLRTARALVEDGSLLIEPPDPAVGANAPVLIDGKMYSKYGVGLVLILLPLVLLGKALAFLPGITENLATGFLISFYNIPFALGTLWLLYETCRRLDLTENRARLVVYATAIGTMFWKYTVTDYSQVTQGFFLMGTVHFLLRARAGDTYWASAFFAGLIVMKLVNVVLWAPCLLYILILHRREGREFLTQAMRFASIVFVAGLALLLYNYLRFGDPLQSGYSSAQNKFTLEFLRRDIADSLFTPQRGLFTFNPVLLAAIPGWFVFFRKKTPEAVLLLGIFALWLPFMASWVSYQGGWAWGNRLLTLIVPLVMVPLGFLALRRAWQKIALGAVLLASFYIQAASVYQHTSEYFLILLRLEERPDERVQMPPQLFGNLRLFHHKLAGTTGSYPLQSFGVQTDGPPVDTSEFETYQGLHIWFDHMGRHFKLPLASLLHIPLLFALCIALARTFRSFKHETTQKIMEPEQDESGVMFKDYAEGRKKKKYLSFRYQSRAIEAHWALSKYGTGMANPHILDLGCAEGLTMALLHKLAGAGRSVGIEYTQELIDSAGTMPEGCSIQQGDVTELPQDLRQRNFQLVTALALLEHISDPAKVFSQVHEALAPGGLFVATCPSPLWDKISGATGLHKEEYHFTDFRWPLFKDLCAGAGLEPVRYKPFMFVPYAFLPYLGIPVSATFSGKLDALVRALLIFRPTFVNQLFVARKPSA